MLSPPKRAVRSTTTTKFSRLEGGLPRQATPAMVAAPTCLPHERHAVGTSAQHSASTPLPQCALSATPTPSRHCPLVRYTPAHKVHCGRLRVYRVPSQARPDARSPTTRAAACHHVGWWPAKTAQSPTVLGRLLLGATHNCSVQHANNKERQPKSAQVQQLNTTL